MSGVAHGKILTIFPTAKIHVLSGIKREDVIVGVCECFITGRNYLEYRFHKKETFDKFLKTSDWYSLPIVNEFDFRYFNGYENGKFSFDKSKIKQLKI